MNDNQEDFLREAAKIFTKLPPLKKIDLTITKESCICGKTVDITDLEALNTGLFLTHSDVCKGCKEGHRIDKNSARVVCVKCKRVLMHIKPGVDKTGFRIVAGKSYHVPRCPQCMSIFREKHDPRIPLIEKVVWNRTHGINTGENYNINI